MSFLIYDISFLIIFSLVVGIFLYKRRKKLEKEGILFLYRTQIGLKAIEYFSKKFKKQLNWIQYISITTGYVLMAVMIYLFLQIVYIYARFPETAKAIKIPPIMPLIPYLPAIFNVSFLPPFYFTYWILILAIVAISHEFAHGIFARFYNIKIKSTGFGFLGPFLAAFVEPDEKEMEKRPIKQQLSILSAGTFANIIVALIFIIIFILFFYIMFFPAGAVFNTYTYSAVNTSHITSVNGNNITNYSVQSIFANLDLNSKNNLTKISADGKGYLIDNNMFEENIEKVDGMIIAYDDLPAVNAGILGAIIEFNGVKIKNSQELGDELNKYKPGDKVNLKTESENNIGKKEEKSYEIILADKGNGKAYLGIGLMQPSTKGIKGKLFLFISMIKDNGTYYKTRFNTELIMFIQDLFWWMILINISVALVNMLPLGIFDGGKVFYLTILYFTKSEDKAKKAFKLMTMLLLILVAVLMIFWFYSMFS